MPGRRHGADHAPDCLIPAFLRVGSALKRSGCSAQYFQSIRNAPPLETFAVDVLASLSTRFPE
jgi:hypothetical protein